MVHSPFAETSHKFWIGSFHSQGKKPSSQQCGSNVCKSIDETLVWDHSNKSY